jgi:hypothetical protein
MASSIFIEDVRCALTIGVEVDSVQIDGFAHAVPAHFGGYLGEFARLPAAKQCSEPFAPGESSRRISRPHEQHRWIVQSVRAPLANASNDGELGRFQCIEKLQRRTGKLIRPPGQYKSIGPWPGDAGDSVSVSIRNGNYAVIALAPNDSTTGTLKGFY